MAEQNQNKQNMSAPDRRADEMERDNAKRSETADRDEALLDQAEDALTDMEARERRRASTYQSGGDDSSSGFDTDMDANAPKEEERTGRVQGGTQ